ncbi:MAG: acyl-CoA dehydrogenase, partial [Planctomycetota bacterium]
MGNFFLDNQDIQFMFEYFDPRRIAELQELHTDNGEADYSPLDPDDAVDNYRRTLEIVGAVSADT